MARSISRRCFGSSRVSPMTFSVAVTTRAATSLRADCSARSRSASISFRADSAMRLASSSAFALRSCRRQVLHRALLRRYVGQEHEPEGEVDEVHGLDQADDREEPGDHSALSFGLSRHAADEGVAGEAVAEGGPDGAKPDREAES